MIRVKRVFLFLSLFGMLVSTSPFSYAELKYNGNSFRDPFFLDKANESDSSTGPSESLKLGGLMHDSKNAKAVINGKMVQVGSKVDGAEIIAIDKDGVKVRQNGKEIMLYPKGRKNER